MCGSWHMPPVIRNGWNGYRMSLRRANYYLTRTPIAYLAYEWVMPPLLTARGCQRSTAGAWWHRAANGICFQSAIDGALSRCDGSAGRPRVPHRLGSRLKTALSSASACSPQHQQPLERSSPRPASSMRMAVLEGRAPYRSPRDAVEHAAPDGPCRGTKGVVPFRGGPQGPGS